MLTFDIVLLIIIVAFTLYGLYSGFIQALGSLVGIVVGAFIASRIFGPIADWVSSFGGNVEIARVVVFFLSFSIISQLVGLLFKVVNAIFKIISIIPFTKTINRLLGALLGLITGLLIVGGVLFIASKHDLGTISTLIDESMVATILIFFAGILEPLFPVAVKAVEEVV